MSEFSSSFHIWTDNPTDSEQRLRRGKVSGIVFGPASRWLTFVPYANLRAYHGRVDPADFAADLCRIVGCPVLHYRYGEDHGWTFVLARPRAAVSRFACWWDPVPTIERDGLDLEVLSTFAPLDAIEPLLQTLDRHAASEKEPAYRFAELLGLPAYKWLSPELAQEHTADFLTQGGRKLGTKPPSTAKRLQVPPSRQIALPRPDLSAREALQLIKPFTARFGAPWHLASLGSYGHIQVDGRGDWRPSYRYAASGDVIHVPLIAKDGMGRLSFQAEVMPTSAMNGAHEAIPLPDEWLDSTDVAAIVGRQVVPEGLGHASLGLMSLAPQEDFPLVWTVFQSAADRGSEFASWILAIDAITGQLVVETLGRLYGAMVVPARQRLNGGTWTDVPPPVCATIR